MVSGAFCLQRTYRNVNDELYLANAIGDPARDIVIMVCQVPGELYI